MGTEYWDTSETLAPLLQFRESINGLHTYLTTLLAEDSKATKRELYDALVLANAIKNEIGDVFSLFSSGMQSEMIAGEEVTASTGQTIEKKLSSDRKGWEHIKLAEEVLRRLGEKSIDLDTGEVLLSSKEIALQLFDYVQPSYWRTTALAKIGINADQYCEVGDYKTSIIIRKVK